MDTGLKSCNILYFETGTGKYAFDGATGMIFAVDDVIIRCIELFREIRTKDELQRKMVAEFGESLKVRAAVNYVIECSNIDNALYLDKERQNEKMLDASKYSANDIKLVQESGGLWQLVLNVTENCNMRCKYCYLSEEYEYTRNRTSRMMDFNTAKKAMDLFFEKQGLIKKYNPGKYAAITFYGGEPLLNFNLIKECVEYTKKNCSIKFNFYVTTNGLLLKDDVADYLVANDFSITISLDGNKKDHDRNRVDAANKGTFDRVKANIERLVSRYPSYDKVSIIGVYDLKSDLIDNVELFKDRCLPRMSMLNAVSSNNTNYYERFSKEDIQFFSTNYLRLAKEYVKKMTNGEKMSSYLSSLFAGLVYSIEGRLGAKERRLPFLPFTGTCSPGSKVSVRVDGTLDLCEKVNYSFPVGNLEDGWDYEKMNEIVVKYNKKIGTKCKMCPISRYCSMCYAYSCGNNDFNDVNCASIIGTFIDALTITVSVLEKNRKAFDELKLQEEWLING